MSEEIMITFLLVITVVMMIITYPTISTIVLDCAKDFEKSCRIRKFLVILSIIPVVNFITMMLLILGVVFEYFIREVIDIVKEIKEGFEEQ